GADPDKLPAFVGVPQGSSAYAVFKVSEVEMPDEEKIEERLRAYRDQAADLYGQAETAAAFELLRERARVEVRLDKLASGDDEQQPVAGPGCPRPPPRPVPAGRGRRAHRPLARSRRRNRP